MNLDKLKGKLTEYGFTYEMVSKQIGRSRAAFSNKINSGKPLLSQKYQSLRNFLI